MTPERKDTIFVSCVKYTPKNQQFLYVVDHLLPKSREDVEKVKQSNRERLNGVNNHYAHYSTLIPGTSNVDSPHHSTRRTWAASSPHRGSLQNSSQTTTAG